MSYILVVDDEEDICDLVGGILEDEGHETASAANALATFESINRRMPDVVILDIWLKGSHLDGIQILKELKKNHPQLPVIVISGHGNIELAVTAMQAGAYDFMEKPLKVDHLLVVVGRALEAANLRRQVQQLQEKTDVKVRIVGDSMKSVKLRETAEKAAAGESRVFIQGASGSGKEILARFIHQCSPRGTGPFVVVNLSLFNAEQLEFELFGVAGDKTERKRVGAFERADQGTIYLEEISNIPDQIQAPLLKFLVTGQFTRVDGTVPVEVNCRIISSSQNTADEIMKQGALRQDLFHRLNVLGIEIPNLSDRREDIALMLEVMSDEFCSQSGYKQRTFSQDALTVLQAYSWPGNVRQLRNVVENIFINMPPDRDVIEVSDVPTEVVSAAPKVFLDDGMREVMSLPLREARELFEREYLFAQLTRLNGNVSRTAEFVGMERSALHRKLKLLGLRTSE